MRGTTFERKIVHLLLAAAALLLFAAALAPSDAAAKASKRNSYDNPLLPVIPGDGVVESCADPSVIRGQDGYWYAYCTTDPLNDEDRNAAGQYNFHFIPILRSLDLVNWTYLGDAFQARPAWVLDGPWAPNIEFYNGLYYLYYTAPDTVLFPGRDSAIGVATSPNPWGPFVDSGAPVVEPRPATCCPGDWYWTYDPDVIEVGGQKYIFFGSYFGGIWARLLTPDGFRSIRASETQITIANRYEGAHVVQNGGYFYLFVSATDCCRGRLTGYSVFVGRSTNVLGPYVDRSNHSFLEGLVGGTVFLSMNGNAFVGPGHNFVIQDFEGQWWTYYHAINRFDPYFAHAPGFTKRPLMLDPVDWSADGWPTVRGGYWVSDTAQHGPAAQPGDKTNYRTPKFHDIRIGKQIPELSDEFNSATFTAPWTWVRQPPPGTYSLTGSTLRWVTQTADLHEGNNTASVLTEPAPKHDYMVETRLRLDVPAEGCCFNFTQAGSVIYANDDHYIKLVDVSIWETRQTEFAKETMFPHEWHPTPGANAPNCPGVPYPCRRYGNTVVGPPGDHPGNPRNVTGVTEPWTYLRIVRCERHGEEAYIPYTSANGTVWERGGTWTHNLGDAARIGLVSMGRNADVPPFAADFDYVRVYRAHGCSHLVDSPQGSQASRG